jgi:hypothetical protein
MNKKQRSITQRKDERDITAMYVRIKFVYRTVVQSHCVITDVRYSNTLNTVSSLCVVFDLKEALNCAASLICK